MKKLVLFLSIFFLFGNIINAQNTLKISSNTFEVLRSGASAWKATGVSLIRKNANLTYTIAGFGFSNDIQYGNISSVIVNNNAPVAPVSFDSLYTLMINNLSSTSGGGGGGGSSFDGQLKQNGSSISSSNPLPVMSTISGMPTVNINGTVPVSGNFTATFDSTQSRKVVSIDKLPTLNINSGTVTATLVGTIPLPTGAANTTIQSQQNANLLSINSMLGNINNKFNPLGQNSMAGSTPVVLASNQSSIPVTATISGTPSVSVSNFPTNQVVSGTVSSTIIGTPTVNINGSVPVTGTFFQATQPISGAVTATISGTPTVNVNGTVPVSGTFWQATQPVSIASLPLATGAATSAAQTTGNNSLSSIDTKLPVKGQALMAASTPVVLASDQSPIPVSGTFSASFDSTQSRKVVRIENLPATQAISASALPLPTGASTSAAQSTGNSSLASIDSKTPALGQSIMVNSVPVTIASNQSAIPVTGTFTSSFDSLQSRKVVRIENLPGTQIISGSVTATISGTPSVSVSNFPATQPISAASLPLPTGAATETTLAALNTKVTAVNTGAVVVSSSALPTGAASSALQTTGNTTLGTIATNTTGLALESGNLATINAKIPTQGQALAAGSLPVVLPASQISSLTPLSTITVTQPTASNLNANITNISGTVSLPTGASTSSLQTAGNTSLASIDSKLASKGQAVMSASTPITIASDQSPLAVTGTFWQSTQPISGSVTATISGTPSVNVSNFPATQTISGLVTANAGTNLNTSALALESGGNLATINSKLLSGQGTTATSLAVTLPQSQINALTPLSSVGVTQSTASNLNATVVGTGTFAVQNTAAIVGGNSTAVVVDGSAVTQPISASSLPLPAGAATSVLQTTANTSLGNIATNTTGLALENGGNLAAINTKTPALGQNVMASSSPVVIASDQVVPVSGSVSNGAPLVVTDIPSGAIAATATSAAFTPSFGNSHSFALNVTAVTGTTPTMDIDIQESDDGGTNYTTVYSFPRITATGFYRTPQLLLRGNKVRYVQTIGGTTPSFTRSINRLQSSNALNSAVSQVFDRTIVLTTLTSATQSLNIQNAKNAQLVIRIGTTTIAPILQLQGSDDNGASWYALGGTLTAVANSTVQLTVPNVNAGVIRAVVTTAGTATVANYVMLKGF